MWSYKAVADIYQKYCAVQKLNILESESIVVRRRRKRLEREQANGDSDRTWRATKHLRHENAVQIFCPMC